MTGEEKKYLRKLTRCIKILEKDFPELSAANESEEHQAIHIGNLGHTTGYDEVSLLKCLQVHGADCGITKLALYPGKQYCFVKYSSAADALTALHALTSRKSSDESNKSQHSSIYAFLVSAIPDRKNDVQRCRPPGLSVWEDFISPEEELSLLHLIDWHTSPTDPHHGSSLKNRSVRHFGYEFEYDSNSIDVNKPLSSAPIPDVLLNIIERMLERQVLQRRPDQVTVNRYLPGQGIPPHTDSHDSCGAELASISVGGAVVMDWSVDGRLVSQQRTVLSHHSPGLDPPSYEGTLQYALLLLPRSLCVFSKEARYCWQHGIKTRQYDVHESSTGELRLIKRQLRISFTFRESCAGPCNCSYHFFCPRRLQETVQPTLASSSMSVEVLETQHVQAVYDNIALHFSDTRHKPWPNVRQFIESLAAGSWLLDIGCGNGKYLGLNTSLVQVGCDNSMRLLSITQDRGHETVLCSCLALPFRDASYDAVICIAVLHHLASYERRLAGIVEATRVLRSKGRALIYVWALEQTRGNRRSSYLKKPGCDGTSAVCGSPCTLPSETSESTLHLQNGMVESGSGSLLPVHENRTQFIQQDMLVPWKMNKNSESSNIPQVFHRFYHTFREGELEQMCASISGIQIIKSYYDEGNWCIVVEKD
ncbi:Methyltransferase type 11 [Trinorchestia longiramus]|nr:Methyltransferase type 11 [Trinorchestia longiramus]